MNRDNHIGIQLYLGCFTITLQYECGMFSAENQRIQENINWIRSVVPRSLVLRRFSGVTSDTANLVWNPLLLRQLTIEVDQRQQTATLERVKEILQRYNNLNKLSITCNGLELQPRNFPPFNTFVVNVAQNLLSSLEFKQNLTELTVGMRCNINPNAGLLFGPLDHYATRILGTLAEGPTIQKDTWLQNPVKLTKLKIHLPTLTVPELRRWKKFLDGQDRLTLFQANLGHLHWSFFSTALEKSAHSLEALDLVLINWYEGNVRANNGEIPEDQWFNWNLILPAAAKLKTLRLCTTCANVGYLRYMRNVSPTWPHDTVNFRVLTAVVSLQQLFLGGIYLSQIQLGIIFTEIRSLRNVKLAAWTKIGEATLMENFDAEDNPEAEDYSERNQDLCNLLIEVMVMTRKQFVSIRLKDISLMFCPDVVRNTVLKQPVNSAYSVTWPSRKWLAEPGAYFHCPLSIQRIK